MSTFLETVRESIDEASRTLGLSEGAEMLVAEPKNIIEVSFPVRMDDGNTRVFKGWRVQHNDALGPYKGGIRFAPSVDRDEVTALATTMTIKNAAHALPYGGAKGGVQVAPRELSTRELEGVSRGYVAAIFKVIGPDIDVPAPDVNTNPTIMGWMMDEYSKIAQRTVPNSFTGKPIVLGGTHLREEATGYGGYVILREALREYGNEKSPEDTTVAVQGFGNVGATIARLMAHDGYKVVAIADAEGGLYDEGGLDIDAVEKAQVHAGTIEKNRCYPKALKTAVPKEVDCKVVSPEEFLALPVDILIPAAIEGVINEHTMNDIKAGTILELANGAIDGSAERYLTKQGTLVIPDVIANGGGVATSYLEWVENREGRRWQEKETRKALDDLMKTAFQTAFEYSKKDGGSLRKGAYVAAIGRIVEAMRARGWLNGE